MEQTPLYALLGKQAAYECVLVNPENVICYLASTRQMYRLRRNEPSVSPRLLLTLPAGTPSTTGSVDTYLWDLSAQEDGAGNLVIAWRYTKDYVDSINLLRVFPDGLQEHHVVKESKKFGSFWSLRTFVVERGAVQFFYTDYSEKYFSPVLDTGSIEKLWTLGWRDGKVVFDVQLSEKGTAHSTRYDVSYQGDGIFNLAWTEQRIGSLFGARKMLKLGTVSIDQDRPKVMETISVPIDEWGLGRALVYPIVAAKASSAEFGAVVELSYGTKKHGYRTVQANGKVDAEIPVEGEEIRDFGYDRKTGLSRYVRGRLTGFLRTPPAIKAEIHWTDFKDRDWVEQLETPNDAVFLDQRASDCFYWMERVRGAFEMRKKCRRDG